MGAEQNGIRLAEICRLAALIYPETDDEIAAMDKIFDGIGEMQECIRDKR